MTEFTTRDPARRHDVEHGGLTFALLLCAAGLALTIAVIAYFA